MQKLLDTLKDVASSLTAIIAICYIAGFLTINFYLSRYNIQVTTVLQPRYISTGFLFFTIIIVALLLFISGLNSLNKTTKFSTTLNIIQNLVKIITIFTISIVIYYWTTQFILKDSPFNQYGNTIFKETYIHLNILVFLISTIDSCINIIHSIFRRKARINRIAGVSDPAISITHIVLFFAKVAKSSIKRNKILISLTIILFICFSIRVFAFKIYPVIPTYLSGGYPIKINLLLDSTKIDSKSVNLFERIINNENCINNDNKAKTCKTRDLLLIEELSNSYVVLAKNRNGCFNEGDSTNTISDFLVDYYRPEIINKSLVQGIIASGEFLPFCQSITDRKIIDNKVILRLNVKNNDTFIEMSILQQKDNKYLLNYYNKWTQIVEIKNAPLKKIDNKNNKAYYYKSNHPKITKYSYKSNNPKVTKFHNINIYVNEDEQNVRLDFIYLLPDTSKNYVKTKFIEVDTKTINIIQQNNKPTITAQKLQSKIWSSRPTNRPCITILKKNKNKYNEPKIKQAPSRNSEIIKTISMKKLNWRENLTNLLESNIFKGNKLNTFKVKNKMVNWINDSTWYEIYFKLKDKDQAYITGWIEKNNNNINEIDCTL